MIDFEIDWRDAPGVRDPVLARTWCALTIRIDDQVVTRLSDKRTNGWRDAIHGSVFPMCAWIVDNLWFLLYEPYRWAIPYGSRDLARIPADRPWVQRHSLLAAREGGALPDLTFCRDGDAVLARWLRDGGDATHPFIRFVREGHARLDPDALHMGLAQFVSTVLARVADMDEPEVAQLRDDWRDVQSLAHGDKKLCIWSARLGINAHYDDELSDADARRLESVMAQLDPQLGDDLLDAATIETIRKDLDWLQGAHGLAKEARRSAPGHLLTSSNDATLDQGRRDQRNSTAAFSVGYAHAQALRAQASEPLGTLSDLPAFVRDFGWADTPAVPTRTQPASPLHALIDYGRGDVPFIAYHSTPTQTGQRFLLARSLFIQACSSQPQRRLVTDSHTWNQRASRAFAAELLAPAESLRQRIGGDRVTPRQMESLAHEFDVDLELIERQIDNHALATVDRGGAAERQW